MTSQASRNPPFRAEHLGSLLRPDYLLAKRGEVDRGEATETDLQPVEDQAVTEAVQLQHDLGFHAVSDGEYRRHMFWGAFWPSLEGMTEIKRPPPDMFRSYLPDIAAFMREDVKPAESVVCTDKIRHVGSANVDQFKFVRGIVSADQARSIKLTLAAPNWYHLRYREGRAYPRDVYASDDEYFADIAKAYQAELQELYDAGLRNVQFDDPNLAYFCSESMLEGWKADAENQCTADELFEKYIALYNACLSKRPPDMHVGVHLCRGNFVNSRHFAEGGYDRIAARLFRDLDVDTYYLEYDTPRAGGFEPLQHLPPHKNVVVGVVSSKFAQPVEDLGEMRQRVLAAAEFVAKGSPGQGQGQTVDQALQRMGVSPQCGFASHSWGNAIDRDGMVTKLKLVKQLAESLWPGER